ncbi:ESX secretion-associated protein EspG [Nocardia altamirensis]|uniref:ESX secretion-associated protein EspG n=1 Tax=Nocardia altamirensis TaxID=472158 RepID=UPI00084023E4|nr:ESX secretion-associated protein EspG [Nocardia altamirensis]
MSRTWHLSDVEFVSLWEGVTDEAVPAPLAFSSRTPRYDDYVREMFDTRERLRASLDPVINVVLQTISRPDIGINAYAYDPRDPQNPKRCVRLLGARRDGRGYVTKQLPGETLWHSGGFTIFECDEVDLAAAVVRQLPDAAAGRRTGLLLPVPDDDTMDHRYGRSDVLRSVADSPERAAAAFLDEPTALRGTIDIIQGHSLFGPRGITGHTITWRDVIDDGRYAITPGNHPTANGVDAKRLAAMVDTAVAEVVRAIDDEHV